MSNRFPQVRLPFVIWTILGSIVHGWFSVSAYGGVPDPASGSPPAKPPASVAASPQPSVTNDVWHTDYAAAYTAALQGGQMLFIYFAPKRPDAASAEFEKALADPNNVTRLSRVVKTKIPQDAAAPGDTKTVLLQHPAFAEMEGRPGVAILDLAHRDAPYYRRVVSVFPFLAEHVYHGREVAAMLDLPPGTLTQRSLIYAVRVHPEHPASTNGALDPQLAVQAESQANYQARIGVQGHQHWETRFHLINALLPRGLLAKEVCAESWPRQGLLQSALECVRCWRLSSGHWHAVSGNQPLYGYDMKRGQNGIWYATGIFGGRGD